MGVSDSEPSQEPINVLLCTWCPGFFSHPLHQTQVINCLQTTLGLTLPSPVSGGEIYTVATVACLGASGVPAATTTSELQFLDLLLMVMSDHAVRVTVHLSSVSCGF